MAALHLFWKTSVKIVYMYMYRKSQKLSDRKKLLLTVKDTLMQHAVTVVLVLKLACAFKTVFKASSKCWNESGNSECADFTMIHVLMIIMSKPSAVSHTNLYWKFSPTMPNAPQLTSSAWNRVLALNDSCNCQNKAGVGFLSHLPTANFQSFTWFQIKWSSWS